jgi:hypothetical protein
MSMVAIMNVYQISAYSKCGSYFQPYLQSITVIAPDESSAMALCNEWLKKTEYCFVNDNIEIDNLGPAQQGVITYNFDSDY